MKNYLSFGGGVNSVALYLLMEDMGIEFEAVFVNHGGDWPETYEYVDYFIATGRQVTVLTPEVEGFSDIISYYMAKKKLPSIMKRDCTDKFKLRTFYRYAEKPCFVNLGIDAGESHRAKINVKKGSENRFPLIERGIDRDGCVDIIKNHGLIVPPKSGCFFCMFQKPSSWRRLRREKPDLFCKAKQMEDFVIQWRFMEGKDPLFLCNNGKPLTQFVNEKQGILPGLESLEYPPCQCGL